MPFSWLLAHFGLTSSVFVSLGHLTAPKNPDAGANHLQWNILFYIHSICFLVMEGRVLSDWWMNVW